MRRTQAGGVGGGITSHFDEPASDAEVAAFLAAEQPIEEPAPTEAPAEPPPAPQE